MQQKEGELIELPRILWMAVVVVRVFTAVSTTFNASTTGINFFLRLRN